MFLDILFSNLGRRPIQDSIFWDKEYAVIRRITYSGLSCIQHVAGGRHIYEVYIRASWQEEYDESLRICRLENWFLPYACKVLQIWLKTDFKKKEHKFLSEFYVSDSIRIATETFFAWSCAIGTKSHHFIDTGRFWLKNSSTCKTQTLFFTIFLQDYGKYIYARLHISLVQIQSVVAKVWASEPRRTWFNSKISPLNWNMKGIGIDIYTVKDRDVRLKWDGGSIHAQSKFMRVLECRGIFILEKLV